jgi:hypothetical protein
MSFLRQLPRTHHLPAGSRRPIVPSYGTGDVVQKQFMRDSATAAAYLEDKALIMAV